MTNWFKARMLTIDPNYGSQQHQRDYLQRYEDRQAKNPCPHDHEHTDNCYRVKKTP